MVLDRSDEPDSCGRPYSCCSPIIEGPFRACLEAEKGRWILGPVRGWLGSMHVSIQRSVNRLVYLSIDFPLSNGYGQMNMCVTGEGEERGWVRWVWIWSCLDLSKPTQRLAAILLSNPFLFIFSKAFIPLKAEFFLFNCYILLFVDSWRMIAYLYTNRNYELKL